MPGPLDQAPAAALLRPSLSRWVAIRASIAVSLCFRFLFVRPVQFTVGLGYTLGRGRAIALPRGAFSPWKQSCLTLPPSYALLRYY